MWRFVLVGCVMVGDGSGVVLGGGSHRVVVESVKVVLCEIIIMVRKNMMTVRPSSERVMGS